MGDTAPRTRIKLSDVKGPYPLLAVFLLIVESLLGFWLFRADSAAERIIAGCLMAGLLAGFLYVVTRIQREPVDVPTSPGLGKLEVATELATRQEIEKPEPQKIAGPDRSYLINKPPPTWTIREMTSSEFLRERMEVGSSVDFGIFAPQTTPKDILVFKAPNETAVIPQPGKTLTEGRLLPRSLAATIPVQLSILPMEQYAPPFFVETPIEHTFVGFVAQALSGLTLKGLRSGILPNTQIRYVQAEMRQDIRNAIVNEKAGLDVSLNAIIMGIEGELRDHILILHYPSLPGGSNPNLDQDLKDLLTLANSFKPLEVTPERKKEIQERTDQEFKEFIDKNGQNIFFSEFAFAILRFDALAMENPETRNEALQVLKPFEESAQELNLQDEELAKLWAALREAEKGDATNLKSLFLSIRSEILARAKEEKEPESEPDAEPDPELPAS